MSIPPKHASSAEAAKAGWFSRRHRTSAEHLAAQRKREAEKKQQNVEANERRLAAEAKKAAKAVKK